MGHYRAIKQDSASQTLGYAIEMLVSLCIMQSVW